MRQDTSSSKILHKDGNKRIAAVFIFSKVNTDASPATLRACLNPPPFPNSCFYQNGKLKTASVAALNLLAHVDLYQYVTVTHLSGS